LLGSGFVATGNTLSGRAIEDALKGIPDLHRDILAQNKVEYYVEPYIKLTGGRAIPDLSTVLGLTSTKTGRMRVYVADRGYTQLKGKEFTIESSNLVGTALHETGHAIDILHGQDPSWSTFPQVTIDALELDPQEKKMAKAYFLGSAEESFAELYRAAYDTREKQGHYFGGLTPQRTREVFAKSIEMVKSYPYKYREWSYKMLKAADIRSRIRKGGKLQAVFDEFGPPLNSLRIYLGPKGKKLLMLIQFDGSIHPCKMPKDFEKLPVGYYNAKDMTFIRGDD